MKVKLVESLDSNGNELSPAQDAFFKRSKVRNAFGDLLVVYRGTVSQNERNHFSGNVKWFTSSREYADKYVLSDKDTVYSCYLNCNNIFDCGNTDGRVFKLNPVQLSLTDEFKAILAKLDLTEQLFVTKFKQELKDRSSYTWHIYTIVRTDKFVDLVRRSGYDCIHTIEEGNNDCYGVLYDRCIKLTSNDNPTNSDNINESLYRKKDGLWGDIYWTHNIKDMLSLINEQKDKDWRVLYDNKLNLFIFGNAYYTIHAELLSAVVDNTNYYDKDDRVNFETYFDDMLSDKDLPSMYALIFTNNPNDSAYTHFPIKKKFKDWYVLTRTNDVFNKLNINESLTEDVERMPADFKPEKVGKAYKVFYEKDGKLYPPMVANKGGADTPIGVWLKAQVADMGKPSKTGRPQVQGGGKGTKSGKLSLAFRPGWHLGDIPLAKQFLKKDGTWPKDLVWAECDYAMDVDYQDEANERGYWRTKVDDDGNVSEYRSDKYQHSLAGLKKIPENGYYKYRTNPNPDTVPWVITGAMKVNRILSNDEVEEILKKAGVQAPKIEEQLDETLRRVEKDVLVTYNTKDVIDRLSENEHDWRLMYDDHEKMWLMGDANDVIHFDLLSAAWDNGYFDDQMDFIDEYIGASYESYRDCGEDGFYINWDEPGEEWVEPWLYSLIYATENSSDLGFYKQDGFSNYKETSLGGTLFARDPEALEETPLTSILTESLQEQLTKVSNRTTDPVRILYDSLTELYMLGTAYSSIHMDLLQDAWDKGYYDDMYKFSLTLPEDDFTISEPGTSDNYFNNGYEGYWDEKQKKNIDPWLHTYVVSDLSMKSDFEYDDYIYSKNIKGTKELLLYRHPDDEDTPLFKYLTNQ